MMNCNSKIYPFENVFFESPYGSFEDTLEQKSYLLEVLTYLKSSFDLFEKYNFYVIKAEKDYIPESLKQKADNKILIWIGDQEGIQPSDLFFNNYKIIFKCHLRKESDEKKIYSFPLGIPFSLEHNEILPINKRSCNVFYSGNLNINRYDLYKTLLKKKSFSLSKILAYPLIEYLNNHKDKPLLRIKSLLFRIRSNDFSSIFINSYVKFTRSYASGLSFGDYITIMGDSKIVLSPRGFFNSECFRFYEALRSGCIVVTEKLPETNFHDPRYYIEINDWSKIYDVIDQLLNDREKLETMSKAAIEYYEKSLSPEAAAKYMFEKIKGIQQTHNEVINNNSCL